MKDFFFTGTRVVRTAEHKYMSQKIMIILDGSIA